MLAAGEIMFSVLNPRASFQAYGPVAVLLSELSVGETAER